MKSDLSWYAYTAIPYCIILICIEPKLTIDDEKDGKIDIFNHGFSSYWNTSWYLQSTTLYGILSSHS